MPLRCLPLLDEGSELRLWPPTTSPPVALDPERDVWFSHWPRRAASTTAGPPSPVYPGASPWALTAPVFVDADEDGSVTPHARARVAAARSSEARRCGPELTRARHQGLPKQGVGDCFRAEPVLPPIVVDLGPSIRAGDAALVIEACNEAISEGECLPESSLGDAVPRAVATARPEDAGAREVEIEVWLPQSGQPPLIRELRFAATDPVRERWRSVGFAIATLVGEVQRAAEETAPEQGTAPEPAPPVEPAPPPQPPPRAAPRPPPSATVLSEAAAGAPSAASAAAPAPDGVFLGVGALSGPALDDGSWRLGAGLRGGVLWTSGWMLLGTAKYSVRAFRTETFTVSWWSLELGAGYRVRLAERISAGLSLQAGVHRLELEAAAQGQERSTRTYDPVLTASADLVWWPWPRVGVWGALDLHSVGRRNDLFVADSLVARSFPLELGGMLGVVWKIR